MKFRTDFVTNSSSSSFIISNKKLSSKEEVFNKIKDLYRDYQTKVEEIVKYCKTDKRFIVKHKDGWYQLSVNSKIVTKTPYFEIWEELEEKFGCEIYHAQDKLPEWVEKCNTYNDFVSFFENDKYRIPFTLIDTSETLLNEDEEVKDIIEWYFPCFDSHFDEIDCEYCNEKTSERCDKVKGIKTLEELLSLVEAKIIVSSECGYIPEYIVSELSKISTLFCNHMG